MTTDATARLIALSESLTTLSEGQIEWVEQVVAAFALKHKFVPGVPQSDLVGAKLLQDFGDTLRIHHCFSREPFTKDKFEYALERLAKQCDLDAQLAPKGNPGHDITIDGQRFSLKTQGDKNLRPEKLHISKFMELGRGSWTDNAGDLVGLRDQFFTHMSSYDRILQLRGWRPKDETCWVYELVEIPKALMQEAMNGTLSMRSTSKQMPKPGYCAVLDEVGRTKFQMYFDGGTERKLQIKNLDKALCTVHATWTFEPPLVCESPLA